MHSVGVMVLALVIALAFHELGHALFALLITKGPVRLVVGLGLAVPMRIGRLTVKFGAIPIGGFCVHEAAERRGDQAMIAAAGPVFSLLFGALAYYLHPRLMPGSHQFLGDLCGQLTFVSTFIALFSLAP